MQPKQLNKPPQLPILTGLFLIATLAFHAEAYSMGWLEKKYKERDQIYWSNLEKSKLLIKQQTDRGLIQLGYDPTKLAAVVMPRGEGGDVAWTVKYWFIKPKDYTAEVGQPGDLEVSLNNQGKIRRVVKYENGVEQLIYGKDERIAQGMTPDQVRERLGEPDHAGKPPRELRDVADEMWTYKASATGRTMRIEVLFKDGEVFSFSSFGE